MWNDGSLCRIWACCFLHGAHSHLLFEVDLRQGVVFLAVFDFSVALIDEVVAGSDVVVAVILDAFLGILGVELILFKNAVEQLLINGHLLLSWK